MVEDAQKSVEVVLTAEKEAREVLNLNSFVGSSKQACAARVLLVIFSMQALTAEESSCSDEDSEIQHQNKLRRKISSRLGAKSRSDVASHPLASTHIVRQRMEEEEKLKAARLLLDDHCRKVCHCCTSS